MASNLAQTKLLFIAAFFPPAGGVGTFRAAKFVKYLPAFGVIPSVVAYPECEYEGLGWPMDPKMLEQIPAGTQIYRPSIPKVVATTDLGVRWAIGLIGKLLPIIHREQPHLLMITGDPFFPMLVGAYYRITQRHQYILDFRDPWTLAARGSHRRTIKARVIDIISMWAEAVSIMLCERAIVVSGEMKSAYVAQYPSCRKKFVVLPNGYDPEDYITTGIDRRAAGCLVYTGKFRVGEGMRDPLELFKALVLLKRDGLYLPFVHIGRSETEIERLAASVGMEAGMFRGEGFLSFASTIECVKGARIAVVIGTGQRTEQTTKVFDYMACNKPILAIVNTDSNVCGVLKGYRKSVIVANEAAAISKGIRELLQAEGFPDDQGRLSNFSRISVAERLGLLINESSEVDRCAV